MEFIRFLLALLLYNSCESVFTAKAEPKSELVELPAPEYLPENSHGARTNRPKLTDLDTDVLFLIFEHFDLNDRFNLANSKLASFVNYEFERKYKNLNFEFEIRLSPSSKLVPSLTVNLDERYIAVSNLKTIKAVLRLFGHLIKRITVINKLISVNDSMAAYQLINAHCPSLKQLDLDYIKEVTFEQFTMPFDRVEHLSFFADDDHIAEGSSPLNELFPNLRQLYSFIPRNKNNSFVDYEFPRLEYLNCAWKDTDQAEEFCSPDLKI